MSGFLFPDVFFPWLDVPLQLPEPRQLTAEELAAHRRDEARDRAAKAAKQDEGLHKQKLVQVKAQVEYEARRDRLDDAVRELWQAKPLTDKLVESLKTARGNAVRILASADPMKGPDYAAALAALEKVKIADTLEAGRKLIAETDGKAATTYPACSREAKLVTDRLDASDSLLAQEAADAFRARLAEQTNRLRTPRFDRTVDAEVQDKLDELLSEVTGTEQVAAVNKINVDQEKAAATQRLARLQPMLTDTQHALLARQLGGLDALQADRDFVAALELLGAFDASANKAEADASPGKDQWDRTKTNIPTLLQTARQQLASPSPAVKQQAQAAIDALQAMAAETPGKTITYAVAVARLEESRRLVGGLDAESKKFNQFIGERDKAAVAVAEAANSVTSSLEALDRIVEVIDPADNKGAASADFRLQFDAQTSEFEARSKTAFDTAGLDAEATVAKLTSLASTILETSRNSQAVSKLIGDQKLAEARARYEAARTPAAAGVEHVRGMSTATAVELAVELASIDDNVRAATLPGQIDKPIADVRALAKRAEERADASANELGQKQTNLTKQADEITTKLGTLDEAVKAIGNDKRRADYEKLHAALTAALEQQRAVIALLQLSLLDAAVPELAKLDRDVDEAIAATKGAESWFGGDTVNFSDIKGYFADMKKRLNETELRRFMGTSVFQKTQELAELEKSLGSDPIMDLRRKISALGRSITALEDQAADASKNYDAFVKEVDAIKAKLKGDIFQQTPKYTEYLKGELDGTLPQAASEGGLANARQEAQRLDKLIDDYLKDKVKDQRGVPVALADREKEAVAADSAEQESAARWEGSYNVLNGELGRLTGIDKAELGNLKKMLNDANAAFRKDGVYDVAMAKLRAVRERMALLVANPQGLQLSARNRLPEVNQKWKDSVTGFKEELKTLGDKVSVPGRHQ